MAMMLSSRLLLPLLLASLSPALPGASWLTSAGSTGSIPISSVGDKADYESAVRAFHEAAKKGTFEERKAALDRLVGLGEPAALGLLTGEVGRISSELRKARDAAFQLRYTLERKRELVAELAKRAESDHSLERSHEDQKRAMDEIEDTLARRENTVTRLTPWFETLREGSQKFAASLAAGKRKKVEKDIWGQIDDSLQLSERLAGIELLGYLGSDGTAVSLQKLIADMAKERAGLERKLRKLAAEVRKLESRLQEEAERDGGRAPSMPQYDRAKTEAADMQRAITALGHMGDAASEAGAIALAREQGAVREKSILNLMRAQKKGKDGTRRRTLEMLAGSGLDEVHDQLLVMLSDEKEALVRATLIDALALTEDERFATLLLGKLILDESWFVKSRAAAAMSRMRLPAAIPILIDGLEREQGRLKTDYRDALISLTGEDYRSNVTLWRRWWGDNKEGFVVPPIDEIKHKASEEAKAKIGTTFFGISTESERVLFVLDLSGSMDFSMVPRDNPEDDRNRPFDMPQGGELSRLEEARIALTKAIGGTPSGAIFNIIFYASDVWTWQDDLVELSDDLRSESLRMIEELDAVGATNVYGALAVALEMAGAKVGDEWTQPEIDTIFFLSDGRPSVGLATAPDEILAFVRELNASAGIVIHTIGLSGAQDAYLMRSLAEQNGGKYVAR